MAYIAQSCAVNYSFTGANINPNLKNFYIAPINNRATVVQPTLAQTLNNTMRQKFQTQTPLRLTNSTTADLVFEVTITDYVVEPVVFGNAGGQAASRNRLRVTMQVNCINNINEKDGWQQTFTPRFAEFESTQDLTTIENKLLEQICGELADDIFNKSFVNW
jgi:hypothetical protein